MNAPEPSAPHRDPEIVLIAAVARNGVIGRDGGLVFNEPADQKHFRDATLGCPVIMGRRTWDSLPARFRPLPGRHNLIVSGSAKFTAPGADVVPSLDAALTRLQAVPRVFVIGGARLYAEALPRADVLMLTEIDADLAGDTHFPVWDRARYRETARAGARTDAGIAYHFVTYRRT